MFAVWAFMWQLYGVWQYFAGNVAHIIRGGACGALWRKKLKAPLSNQASRFSHDLLESGALAFGRISHEPIRR